MATQSELNAKIKAIDLKIKQADEKAEKYKGYIRGISEDKKSLNAQQRKLEAEKKKLAEGKAKPAPKKPAAKAAASGKTAAAGKTAAPKKPAVRKTTAKKADSPEPSLLEGVMDEVKKLGFDPSNLIDSLLGGKK